jgi:hypothetical protein
VPPQSDSQRELGGDSHEIVANKETGIKELEKHTKIIILQMPCQELASTSVGIHNNLLFFSFPLHFPFPF